MPDVNISIAANSKEFTTAVQQINASVAGMRDSVQKSVAGMSDMFGGIVGQLALVGTAVNQALGAVRELAAGLSEAWNAATQFQSASVRLAPLVGGLENARELCEALRQSAVNGTASFEELSGVAVKLSSVFKDTKSIETWTKRFHDLAAGTGADMERVVSQFTKAMASGKLDTRLLDTLSMKGVNIYAEIAEQTGMAEAELRKLAQSGQLSFGQIESALISLTSGTGVFANAAKRMSETAGGSWKTLTEQATVLLAKFSEPIIDSITPILRSISATFAELSDTAQDVGRDIASVFSFISSNSAAATTALGALVGALLQISGVTPRITASFTQMIVSIRTQAASLGGVWRATMVSMRTVATTAFAAIRVAGIACMTALKTAIVSTGVGVAIIAIGEAIAYAYGQFVNWRGAIEEAEKSARKFQQTLNDLEEASGNANTSANQAEVVARIQSEMTSIRAELESMDDLESDLAVQRRQQLATLQSMLGVEETQLRQLREQEATEARMEAIQKRREAYEAEVEKRLQSQKSIREQISDINEKIGGLNESDAEYYNLLRERDLLNEKLAVEEKITAERQKQWLEQREAKDRTEQWQYLASTNPKQLEDEWKFWQKRADHERADNGVTQSMMTWQSFADEIRTILDRANAQRERQQAAEDRAKFDADRFAISDEQSRVREAGQGAGSLIQSGQGNIGGGLSMRIGEDIITSLQRRSVSLQEKMAELLETISENTSNSTQQGTIVW